MYTGFYKCVHMADIMIKNIDSGARLPRFKPCPCHLQAV